MNWFLPSAAGFVRSRGSSWVYTLNSFQIALLGRRWRRRGLFCLRKWAIYSCPRPWTAVFGWIFPSAVVGELGSREWIFIFTCHLLALRRTKDGTVYKRYTNKFAKKKQLLTSLTTFGLIYLTHFSLLTFNKTRNFWLREPSLVEMTRTVSKTNCVYSQQSRKKLDKNSG